MATSLAFRPQTSGRKRVWNALRRRAPNFQRVRKGLAANQRILVALDQMPHTDKQIVRGLLHRADLAKA
jgi:hypothetical protein